MLDITCEINSPIEGKNWLIAGAFARDDAGKRYYLHSGRVGGGRKGIGREAFLAEYTGTSEPVMWPDGSQRPMIVLGALDDPGLVTQIAAFVHHVNKFKEAIYP